MIRNINKYENLIFSSTNKNLQYIHSIIEYINSNGNDHINILDIGCGDGSLLKALRQQCPVFNYVGVDISSQNIKIAKQKWADKNTKFILSNYLDTTFNNKFDLIISYSTLNLIEKPNIVVDKIYNQLQHGGIAIICIPYGCIRTHMYILLRKINIVLLKFGLKRIFELFAYFFLKEKYSKEQVSQSMVYMTMIPFFIWGRSIADNASLKGLKTISETIELPRIIGKLSHKIIKLKKTH
tara:strand:- start:1662 stop:2378 length:717 start_codon:yes stop_codon:yes gene_type:complete